MQAIIMAAGKGSRLGDVTDHKPKSFLEVEGKKLIDINIDLLHKYEIWDITIVTGYCEEMFTEYFQGILGINLVFNPFWELTNVIGSYYMGMNRMHDDFIYLHADTVFDPEIFKELLSAEGDIVLPVDTKPCDDEAMKVRVEDGKVVEITKEMDVSVALGEFIGVCKIRKNVIDDLNESAKDVLKDKNYKSYFEGAIQRIIDMNKYDIRVLDTNGRFWGEVDFLDDYNSVKNNISRELLI